MTVTQYVGARYVPDFAQPIEWNNTRTYEPLTIVTHQGNSYTSRQFVPLGIDIENETFWALTGNYNAQVEQYRHEVDIYKADVDSKLPQITEATEKGVEAVEQAAGEYVGLPAKIKANTDLIHTKSAFHGANAIFVGDSWGRSGVYGVTKPYCELLGDILGMNLINLSVGSTGFLMKETFQERITKWVNDNPSLVDTINYIFVSGGINDLNYSRVEITKAILNFITYCNSTFSNATVYVIPQFAANNPTRCSKDLSENPWIKANMAAIVAFYDKKPNAVILYNTYPALIGTPDAWWVGDNIHPKQKGHDYLAAWLSGVLTNGLVQTSINIKPVFKAKAYLVNNTFIDCDVNHLYANNIKFIGSRVFIDCTIDVTINSGEQSVKSIYLYSPFFALPINNIECPIQFITYNNNLLYYIPLIGNNGTVTIDENDNAYVKCNFLTISYQKINGKVTINLSTSLSWGYDAGAN